MSEEEKEMSEEEKQFKQLIEEIKSEGFTESSEVSNYIVNNKLGYKYKSISGYLEMQNDESTWTFDGGFSPEIYAKLCEELGFGNKGTNSKVIGFTPYKDI